MVWMHQEDAVLDNHSQDAVVEVQVSRKRVPAHHWRKSSTSLDTLEGKRNSLATHVTPPPRFAQMVITRQDDGINTNFRSVLSIR